MTWTYTTCSSSTRDTENRFDEECNPGNPNGCIEAFREGRPDDIYYGNAVPSNNPADGAAEWGYKINTAYLQDEWVTMGGDLTLVFGLRYEWYDAAVTHRPTTRTSSIGTATPTPPRWTANLLQPRLGFNWTFNPGPQRAWWCRPLLRRQPQRLAVQQLQQRRFPDRAVA